MKRKSNPLRFRKRTATSPPVLDPQIAALCAIRDLLQRGQHAQALARIDQQVAANPAIDFKSRLLSLAGDCLFKQGKFAEAATAYASIGAMVRDWPLSWWRPALGQVRSLLKAVRVTEAENQAALAVATALAHEQAYQAQLAQAQAAVAAGGQAVIPAPPPSASEVACRLAKQFLAEGEPQMAKTLFQQSLQTGYSRREARLGLAEIALREKNGAEAGRLARDTIVAGSYRASTLPAWRILLAASRQTGTDLLSASLLNGLAQATPNVRARAVLLIVRELRNQGDARWSQVANNWLQTSAAGNGLIAAELRKLRLTHNRVLNATPAVQGQAGQALLQTPGLSPTEFLFAAKAIVRTTLLLNQSPALEALLTQAAGRFGAARRPMFVHGLALACVKANRSDLAMSLLQNNVANATGKTLSQSLWTLAKLQSDQGNHLAAAQSYSSYYQNNAMPRRQRLYALVQWTRELFLANQPDLLDEARPQIEAVLPQITDYELVLDLSRQIRLSRLPREFAAQVFDRGQQLALQAFDASTHPAPAATVLYKLCRRANDHGMYDAMIATWTRLPDLKRQWLWSESADYWRWVEHIFRAYRDSQRVAEAEAFAAPLLNDPATPPHGYAAVAVSYATMKRKMGDFASMFSTFAKMIQVAPAFEWTSAAYYWFALRAWKQGDASLTNAFADKMLLALGNGWTMSWKQDMAACALCLKAGLDLSQVSSQAGFSADKLQAQLNVIQTDLGRLNV